MNNGEKAKWYRLRNGKWGVLGSTKPSSER